jgi:hypothetical protein
VRGDFIQGSGDLDDWSDHSADETDDPEAGGEQRGSERIRSEMDVDAILGRSPPIPLPAWADPAAIAACGFCDETGHYRGEAGAVRVCLHDQPAPANAKAAEEDHNPDPKENQT